MSNCFQWFTRNPYICITFYKSVFAGNNNKIIKLPSPSFCFSTSKIFWFSCPVGIYKGCLLHSAETTSMFLLSPHCVWKDGQHNVCASFGLDYQACWENFLAAGKVVFLTLFHNLGLRNSWNLFCCDSAIRLMEDAEVAHVLRLPPMCCPCNLLHQKGNATTEKRVGFFLLV